MSPSHKGTCDLSLFLSSLHKLGSRFAAALLTSPPCDTPRIELNEGREVVLFFVGSIDYFVWLGGQKEAWFRGPSSCPPIFERLLAILLRRKSLSAAPTSGIPLPRISGVCGPWARFIHTADDFVCRSMFCILD